MPKREPEEQRTNLARPISASNNLSPKSDQPALQLGFDSALIALRVNLAASLVDPLGVV